MKDPCIFGIYGKSGTGKTNLIENLIQMLTKDGFKIATIKKSNKKIRIDEKGKDTWKHSSAGANLVVLSSKIETDFIFNEKIPTDNIVQIISEIDIFDLILIEGASSPNIPKIRLGDIEIRENTICDFNNNIDEILAMLKREIKKKSMIREKVRIIVNNNTIPLSEFPAKIIENCILGMIKSLKGVNKIKDVKILLKT